MKSNAIQILTIQLRIKPYRNSHIAQSTFKEINWSGSYNGTGNIKTPSNILYLADRINIVLTNSFSRKMLDARLQNVTNFKSTHGLTFFFFFLPEALNIPPCAQATLSLDAWALLMRQMLVY